MSLYHPCKESVVKMRREIGIHINSFGTKYLSLSGTANLTQRGFYDTSTSDSNASYDVILKEARQLLVFNSLTTVAIVVSVFLWAACPPAVLLTILLVILKIYIKSAKKVNLRYSFDDDCKDIARSRVELVQNIVSSKKVWRVFQRSNVVDRKYHAGAGNLVKRDTCKTSLKAPFPFSANVQVPVFVSGKEILIFLPDKILVKCGWKIVGYEYADITANVSKTRFVEQQRVPKDATIVDYTWQYVNKSGGPDKRFSNNPKFPVCLYGEMNLSSLNGFDWSLNFSNASVIDTSAKFASSTVSKQMASTVGTARPACTRTQTSTPTRVGHADISLHGEKERTQPIPQRTSVTIYPTHQKFFADMRKYADKTLIHATFVPFSQYWPTYDSMNKQQQDWYFYWRTQVRNGIYPDTDLSYIFVHVYEILSGCGWRNAQSGYDQLMRLWGAYRIKFPKLDHYLCEWSFDFAQNYNIPFTLPDIPNIQVPKSSGIEDIIVDSHIDDRPLKLPFGLIDDLCDYSLVGSKFYIDGHQQLMEEAIPRVVALADAAMVKKSNQGILATCGPKQSIKQARFMYQSAICPRANEKTTITVKPYLTDITLRDYINNLVRYAENVLRELYGYRGRLRGIDLDEETSHLVDAFLKKEYSPSKAESEAVEKKPKVELNFDKIEELQKQSEWVREALTVSEQEPEKELLTDLQEVSAILAESSSEARALFDTLQQSGWECDFAVEMLDAESEINKLANKYLACNLLAREQNRLIVEDDYRDELDHIYSNGIENSESSHDTASGFFDTSLLSDELKQLVDLLSPAHSDALRAILSEEDCQSELERIAEESFTMPEMLIDDINETTNQILNDILIDVFDGRPQVLDQYKAELTKALK